MPALARPFDPCDEDVATPAEQGNHESDCQRDGCNDEDRIRVLSGPEDSKAGQSFADALVLEVLLDDEQQCRRADQPNPEPDKASSEAVRSRTKTALSRGKSTRDNPEAVEAPGAETDQPQRGRKHDGDRRAPRPVVTAVRERLVVAGTVGQEEDEIVGDHQRDESHRGETEVASRDRHDGDYTARPGLRRAIRCPGRTPRRTELSQMRLSDVRPARRGGLASIVVGLGHDVPPVNHLGPHNAIEWALYVGLFAVLVGIVVRVARSRDDTLPRIQKPRRVKSRPDQAPKAAVGSAAPGPDEWLDDDDPGS
jgi:hypothetical protein